MPRKKCFRHICSQPGFYYFKPAGCSMIDIQEVVLEMDEYEAIRLKNFEGLYQDKAAESMQISRQTFGRILDSANKKIAEALITGKAIKINHNNQKDEKNSNSNNKNK
jgi:predicted DNA-binding protein (UPF0251 family)